MHFVLSLHKVIPKNLYDLITTTAETDKYTYRLDGESSAVMVVWLLFLEALKIGLLTSNVQQNHLNFARI